MVIDHTKEMYKGYDGSTKNLSILNKRIYISNRSTNKHQIVKELLHLLCHGRCQDKDHGIHFRGFRSSSERKVSL